MNGPSTRDLTPADWRSQRWRNGNGTTHEVIRWPAGGDGFDDFDVRVSVADITEPGPFSTFPGCHRWIIPLDKPIMLKIPEGNCRISSGAYQLDGETPIAAQQHEGPRRVMNVIAKANRVAVGTSTGDMPWLIRPTPRSVQNRY